MKIFNDIGFTGRPEWGRNNIEFNVANCLFHYIANYDDGIEGTPKFYRGPPKIPKEEANKIIHMNTKDLCKYLYDRIPTHDNIRTQHINFWNVEKFKKYFKNFDSFKISSHAKSINPEFNSNMFDNWKDRSRISLYVEGVIQLMLRVIIICYFKGIIWMFLLILGRLILKMILLICILLKITKL
jgi:hypothetical protein